MDYSSKTYSAEAYAATAGREITALRSECEKQFDLGKGRRQAVQYAEACAL